MPPARGESPQPPRLRGTATWRAAALAVLNAPGASGWEAGKRALGSPRPPVALPVAFASRVRATLCQSAAARPLLSCSQAAQEATQAAAEEDAWMDRVRPAPIYRPSQQEWADPLAYLRTIQVGGQAAATAGAARRWRQRRCDGCRGGLGQWCDGGVVVAAAGCGGSTDSEKRGKGGATSCSGAAHRHRLRLRPC